MLQALLRGKLSREQENLEDILTSNVFGLLSYLPPQVGLLPLLARAQLIDGTRPLMYLADAAEVDSADYVFWPYLQELGCISCEPVVVVRLRFRNGRKLIILVEAKYLSGKSSFANTTDDRPNDQLAREWDNLARVAERELSDPILVFLTADIGIPRAELGASIEEYQQKRPMDHVPVLLALSWRQIPEVYGQSLNPMLQDLCRKRFTNHTVTTLAACSRF